MVLFKKWDQLPGFVEVTYINQDDATLLASLTDTLRCDRRNIWIVSRQIRTVVIKHRRFGKSDILDQRFVLIPKLFCFHIFIQFWVFGFEMTLLANSNSDSEQPKKWLFLLLLLPEIGAPSSRTCNSSKLFINFAMLVNETILVVSTLDHTT